MSKKCGNVDCGVFNPDNAKYCRNCGRALPVTQDKVIQNPPEKDSSSSPVSSSSNDGETFLKILGTIFVIGIVIAIAVSTSGYGTPVAIGGYYALKSIWD